MKVAGFSCNGCRGLSLAPLGLRWMMARDLKRSVNSDRAWTSSIDSIHQLTPWDALDSASGGPVCDHRLSNVSTCGPFDSAAGFHDFLVAPVRHCPRPELVSTYRSHLTDTKDVYFAHAEYTRLGDSRLLTGVVGFSKKICLVLEADSGGCGF
jgi:hypothetical protein